MGGTLLSLPIRLVNEKTQETFKNEVNFLQSLNIQPLKLEIIKTDKQN